MFGGGDDDGAESRRKNFKQGLDADDARKRREEGNVTLRKAKRDEQLRKRRMGKTGGVMDNAGEPIVSRDPMVMEKVKMIPQYAHALNTSQDQQVLLEATMAVRRLLSIERDPPIVEVIHSGIVPKLVEFLSHNNPSLVFEAAWALTNIASGNSEQTQFVVHSGAVPLLVELLKQNNDDVREQAVWALGNIAGDSPECRDLLLNLNIMQPLLALCNPEAKSTMLRNATWTLSNLCRGKPQPNFALVAPCLPVLHNLLWTKDDEVLTDACWALSYISDDNDPSNSQIQQVIATGAVRRLVELMMARSNHVKTPALRTIGNIVTGDDTQTQVVINTGGLAGLLHLLGNEKKGIRKEACWTISNITAGNQQQIQHVIEAGLFPPLIHLLRSSEFDVKKEAAWAVSNATSGGSAEQLRYLVSQAVIAPLCDLFTCSDPKIIIVAMEGIENILRAGADEAEANNVPNMCRQFVEECGGLDKLEMVQHHQNIDVYRKAAHVLTTFFDADDDVDATLEPEVSGGNFSFGVGEVPSGGFTF